MVEFEKGGLAKAGPPFCLADLDEPDRCASERHFITTSEAGVTEETDDTEGAVAVNGRARHF